MAEKKLDQLIANYKAIGDVQNMDEVNPVVYRQSLPTVRNVQTTVLAVKEPTNLILPLNVVWFNFDPISPFYQMALRRVSKTPDAANGTAHTWEVLDTYAQWLEPQFYDDEDAALLNTQDPLPIASISTLGIARLSVPPTDATHPTAVGEGDPRLSDARTPTEHTHPEKPAAQLKTKSGVVTIGNSQPPVAGAVLIATSPTTAVWRQLTSNDIQR